MQINNFTDHITGLTFKAAVLDDGSILTEDVLTGETIPMTREGGNYVIDAKFFNFRQTMTMLQASKYLGVGRMQVSRMCRNGTLNAYKANGSYVIDSESVRDRKAAMEDKETEHVDGQDCGMDANAPT